MKLEKPKSKPIVMALIALGAFAFAFIFSYVSIFVNLELKMVDGRFRLRGPLEMDDSPVVIVSIDDQSDESTPDRWPWPRSYYAHVIENLEETGAKVIGIDVMLDQSDESNPGSDDALAAVLRQYDNIVLTGKLMRTSVNYSYNTLIPPYQKFTPPNSHWGLVTLEADQDGFYRRYPLGQTYGDSLLPSFAAEILRLYETGATDTPLWEDVDYFHLGELQIPKFDAGSMLVNYVGPAFSFPYYSFDNILDDKDFNLREEYDMDTFDSQGDSTVGLPPGLKYSGLLKDKIVLIGATMHELHDNFPTPFLEHPNASGENVLTEMPGVEIHANAIRTILDADYIRTLSLPVILIILLILIGLVFLISRKLSTAWGALILLVLIMAYLFLTAFTFNNRNLLLPVTAPLLAILFSYIGFTVYNYLLAQKEKKMLRGAFAYYVPDSVIQDIMNNPDKLSLGGEERVITVMFTDVAGFTTISEALKPRELVGLLNEYLTEMTDIVLKHQGIIDKYEGDAIMAEFGVPVPIENHARAACSTAIEMQNKLHHLRKQWAKRGVPELHARIGINTGEVIVGNMGSRDVFDYTVMGDHVNLGSRLEGANKFFGTSIMISQYTYEIVKDDFLTRPLDLIRVKGKKKPIEVFELIADIKTKFTDDFMKLIELYTRGVAAYRNRKWTDAADIFKYCLKLFPDDKPSQIYYERCFAYKANPPADDWDGVTTMTEK